MIKRVNLVYGIDKYLFNFQQYEITKSFAKNLFAGKITLDNFVKDQRDLLMILKILIKEQDQKNMEKKS